MTCPKPFTNHLNQISELSHIYNIIEMIGGGSFGTVYRATHFRTAETKALKIASKYDTPHKSKCNREVKILSLVQHPNIVRLEAVYESKNKICLVLEYCPRELSKYFRQDNLSESNVQRIMFYLTLAIVYLHDKGIVHRDLKLENILFGENPCNPGDLWFVKLCDFGVSACKLKTGYKGMLNGFCGTPMYMAPEVATKSYSEQCDIWSMGIIMYLLLERQFPYSIGTSSNISQIVANTTVDFHSMQCTKSASSLVKSCLEVNPAIRITAAEMLHSSWITGRTTDDNGTQTRNILQLMDDYNSKMDKANIN